MTAAASVSETVPTFACEPPIALSGRWTVPRRTVGVRPYPFPFAAAFALSNENTWPSLDLFEAFHAFVSGRGPTPFGEGLGLEVSDALAIGPDGAPRLADDRAGGERLEALEGAGWLDQIYCPSPAAARNFISALDARRQGFVPPVCLGNLSQADRQDLSARGVLFFGDEITVERDKFGDHYDYKDTERLRLAIRGYELRGSARSPSSPRDFARAFNETLQDEQAEGSWRFKRFRGGFLPSAPGFSAQVTSYRLDQLTAHGGAVIVQQQLGRWALIGAAEGRERSRPMTSPALDRHAIAAWREIAERHAAGELWVTRVSALLRHLWRRERMRFHVEAGPERWVITLQTLADGGGLPHFVSADLDGLTLTVPEEAPEVVLRVAGCPEPLRPRREPDPVHRQTHAVHLPRRRLEWPPAAIPR